MSPQPTPPAFHVSEDGDGTVVRFTADTALTDAHVESLGRHPLVTGRGDAPLTLDLSGVTALSSAALGKLVVFNRAVRVAGGRLALTNPSAAVRRVFRVTRLDAIFDIRAAGPVAV